jgi:hypothetical protein
MTLSNKARVGAGIAVLAATAYLLWKFKQYKGLGGGSGAGSGAGSGTGGLFNTESGSFLAWLMNGGGGLGNSNPSAGTTPNAQFSNPGSTLLPQGVVTPDDANATLNGAGPELSGDGPSS